MTVTSCGEVQAENVAPSSAHSKLAVSSAGTPTNVNDVVGELSKPAGPLVISVSGGVVSTIHVNTAAPGIRVPPLSPVMVSRCMPSATVIEYGEEHAMPGSASSAHSNDVAPSMWNVNVAVPELL